MMERQQASIERGRANKCAAALVCSGATQGSHTEESTMMSLKDSLTPGHRLVNLIALMDNYAGTAALLTAFDMQLEPDQPLIITTTRRSSVGAVKLKRR
jgi:hypothetical protein